MRPHPWWRYALPLIVLAVLLSACAGSEAPSGTATPNPTSTSAPLVTATLTPAGFLPTPIGTQTPAPILSLTPVALATPARDIFFDDPEGRLWGADPLLWDGPDDRVSSLLSGHCGSRDPNFGVPALISLVEDRLTFWRTHVIPRETGWRWTGYYHDEWQIWQGDDAWKIYLVTAEGPGVAFEYQARGCY